MLNRNVWVTHPYQSPGSAEPSRVNSCFDVLGVTANGDNNFRVRGMLKDREADSEILLTAVKRSDRLDANAKEGSETGPIFLPVRAS